MSAPDSIADNFLPSLKTRELTVDRPTRSISEYARATAKSCSIPVIDGISVILPRKSTAILPKDKISRPGYVFAMGFEELHEWVKRRLKAKGLSEYRAASLAGHPDSLRNIRRRIAMPKIETLRHLAEVLGEPPPGLFDGAAAPTKHFTIAELEERLKKAEREVEDLKSAISTLKRLTG